MHEFEWDADGAPNAFDWSSALEWIVVMVEMQPSCTEFVLGARPPFALAPDELEDLAIVDRTLRDLWQRYAPRSPSRQPFTTIAEENAAVDAYEAAKAELREVLSTLPTNERWRNLFVSLDHPAVETVRSIMKRRIA